MSNYRYPYIYHRIHEWRYENFEQSKIPYPKHNDQVLDLNMDFVILGQWQKGTRPT